MDNVIPRASSSQIKRSYNTKPVFRPKDLKQDVKTSGVNNMTTAGIRAVVSSGKGKMDNTVKKSRWVWRLKGNYMDHESKENGSFMLKKFEYGNPEIFLQDHVVVDSGCSSHMTGNKAYLSDYEDYNGGFMAFGSDPKGDELKFNLFFVSQMCDKKNSVLFTDTECLILSPSFKLLDESQVVLRAPRKDDVYSLDLKNIVPSGGLENQLNHKVKIIRCNHGTKFKNYAMNELCAKKGIKREFSVARTPQQNGVAERKNRTLIEAARTMLADSLLPIPFWAEAVNTACYVLNRVLVTKPQNKTPYELLIGKPPSISFMRPFGCPLTILNTLDPLGKFDGKSDEGYLLGYSTTRIGPDWMFDLDFLTNTMNYIPVSVENQITVDAVEDVIQDAQEKSFENAPNDKGELDSEDIAAKQALKDDLERMVAQEMATQAWMMLQGKPSINTANTLYVSAASTPTNANAGESYFVYLGGQIPIDSSTLTNADLPTNPNMPDLEDVSNAFLNDGIFSGAYDDDDVGAEANLNNMDHTIDVSPILTLRILKVYPKDQILGNPKSAVQTRGKIQKASLVFRNKRVERSIVVKNKARLVAQGFRQEEVERHEENTIQNWSTTKSVALGVVQGARVYNYGAVKPYQMSFSDAKSMIRLIMAVMILILAMRILNPRCKTVHLDALLAKWISEEEEYFRTTKEKKSEVQEAVEYLLDRIGIPSEHKLEANEKLTRVYNGEKGASQWNRSIERFVPMESDERVKRQGVQAGPQDESLESKQAGLDEIIGFSVAKYGLGILTCCNRVEKDCLSVGFATTQKAHQFTMSNRHQELASPKQTALVKTFRIR
ncbi:ribonuclease H-like domain-containing protein [Tanacetum coccineum]